MLTRFKTQVLNSIGIQENSVLGEIITDTQLQMAVINDIPVDIDADKVLSFMKTHAYRGEYITEVVKATFDHVNGTVDVKYNYKRNEEKVDETSFTIKLEVLDQLNAIIWRSQREYVLSA